MEKEQIYISKQAQILKSKFWSIQNTVFYTDLSMKFLRSCIRERERWWTESFRASWSSNDCNEQFCIRNEKQVSSTSSFEDSS